MTARLGLLAGVTLVSLAVAAAAMGAFASFRKVRSYRVGYDPTELVVADFNHDGHKDVAVTNFASSDPTPPSDVSFTVLRGRSGGRFKVFKTYHTPSHQPDGIALGRFDSNHDPDLAIGDWSSGNILIEHGRKGVRFGNQELFSLAGHEPRKVVVGDFDHDGRDDVAAALQDTGQAAVLLADGTGFDPPQYYAASPTSASGIAAARLNGDERLDLVLPANDKAYILLGLSGGTFGSPSAFAAGPGAIAVATGDFNRDGEVDLAVADVEQTATGKSVISILKGKGDGTFAAPRRVNVLPGAAKRGIVGPAPSDVAVADFDRDGDPDLAVSFLARARVAILRGRHGLNFGAAQLVRMPENGKALLAPRLNRDRRPDLAVLSRTSAVRGKLMVRLQRR